MHGRQKTLTVGDKDVTVNELSVNEVRNWMADTESAAENDALMIDLDDILFEDVRLSDLAVMSDQSIDQLREMRPSQLREIADVCRDVNEHFFSAADRIMPALQKAVKDLAAANSKGPSAD